MSTPTSTGKAPPLNPLALTAETTARFRLLLVTAFVMAWSLASYWFPTNLLMSVNSLGSDKPIINVEGNRVDLEDFDVDLFWKTVAENPEAQAEIRNSFLQVFTAVGLVVAFAVLALVFFRLAPARRLRMDKVRKLDLGRFPILAAELDRLVVTAGLASPPEWYYKAGKGYLDGRAIGFSSRPVLILIGDPRQLDRPWSDQRRSVVLHELAHGVNRDTETREGAMAAAFALGLLSVVTAIFVGGWRESWSAVGVLLGRLAAVAVIGWGIWAGLVRAREHFADWRVLLWGVGDGLRNRLGLPEAFRPGGFGFHPSNRDRLQVLAEPKPLFGVSRPLALLTGVVLGLAAGNLGIPASHIEVLGVIPVIAAFLVAGMLPSIVVALGLYSLGTAILLSLVYWVVGALGIQILRSAVGDLATVGPRDWGYLRLFLIALLFVFGFELGLWLTPVGWSGWRMPLWMVVWLAISAVLIWLWLIQARALGRLVLGAWVGTSLPLKVELRLHFFLTLLAVLIFWPVIVGRVAVAAAELARSGVKEVLSSPVRTWEFFWLSTSLGLLTVALIGSGLLGLIVFWVIRRWLARRRPVCAHCCEPWLAWRSVGLRCGHCGEPGAAWLFVRPSDDSAETGTGEAREGGVAP